MNLSCFNFKNLPALSLLLILFLSLQACATHHGSSRGRLSDAMEKASDKNTGSRRGSDPDRGGFSSFPSNPRHTSESEDCWDVAGNCIYPELTILPSSVSYEQQNNEDQHSSVGFFGGVGLLRSDEFAEMTNLNISYGTSTGHSRFDFYLGGAWAGVNRTSEMDDSIDDGVFLLNMGVDFRYMISQKAKWHAPYLLFGGAYNWMWWEYENGVTTTDGETIYYDGLEGIELHAGIGKNLFQINGSQVGIEVVPSVIFWLQETREGFWNDVFDPFFILKIRAVLATW